MVTGARDVAVELAEAKRAYIVSPAGYGKTHSIAEAVSIVATSQGRQLVLTHTHAGVHSLRAKLSAMRVPSAAYRVDTIAGWCLHYAASYRLASGLQITEPRGDEWAQVYGGAERLLKSSLARDVVLASYGGLFVDEYQDCQREQHQVVLALAELLPCRVLGDPLQAIYGFRGQEMVDFDADLADFERLDDLNVPYRWKNVAADDLAEWLIHVRSQLLKGESISLIDAPVKRVGTQDGANIKACYEVLKLQGTCVAIHGFANQAHDLARKLKGSFGSMEEIECETLMSFCGSLDKIEPVGQAVALVDHASDCMTAIKSLIQAPTEKLRCGEIPLASRYSAVGHLVAPLASVAEGGGAQPMLDFLSLAKAHADTHVHRPELFGETMRTLRIMAHSTSTNYSTAAWEARNRTRQIGRRSELRAVSRTLLIKGLEYDNALVLGAEKLDRNNLYVALTRGSRTLSVQASGWTLSPKLFKATLSTGHGKGGRKPATQPQPQMDLFNF
jgi:hypothetical protein